MLTPAVTLKEKLATDDPVVGIMATDMVSPLLVEICQRSGLDYLIVDSEHGCFSDETVAAVCQAGRLAGFPILVRTISTEPSVIRRTIDLGPCGILLPNIESTGQLDDVRNAAFMPPRGTRRPGGMGNYWMKNFHYDSWRDDFEEHFIVIPQIESRLGVTNAKEIAAHSLVTALGVGPYDLSADIGCCWNPENEEFKGSIQKIREAGDGANKKVWMGTDVEALLEKGFTFLWIGTFTSVLSGGISNTVGKLKQARKGDLAATQGNEPPPA